jgi:hypothetical protein
VNGHRCNSACPALAEDVHRPAAAGLEKRGISHATANGLLLFAGRARTPATIPTHVLDRRPARVCAERLHRGFCRATASKSREYPHERRFIAVDVSSRAAV